MKTKTASSMPLSPHLWIYRWQSNMVLSILHRMTGFALYFFLLFICWFFSFSVILPDSSITLMLQGLLMSWFGKLVIGAGSFLFYYHLLNGIRHLFWNSGHGLDIKTMQFTGVIVIFCSVVLTGITFASLFF